MQLDNTIYHVFLCVLTVPYCCNRSSNWLLSHPYSGAFYTVVILKFRFPVVGTKCLVMSRHYQTFGFFLKTSSLQPLSALRAEGSSVCSSVRLLSVYPGFPLHPSTLLFPCSALSSFAATTLPPFRPHTSVKRLLSHSLLNSRQTPSAFISRDIKGALFWDYSGIGILGIDGICVLLGAIPFSE